ncbi:glycosyltransferase, partial [Hamadaea sp. NPDC051192]|uniref:glycosyltransferase n=1 Tax=Hamadaea sp. NPDC051192 TaxID=3154940 RepID=UPI003421860B
MPYPRIKKLVPRRLHNPLRRVKSALARRRRKVFGGVLVLVLAAVATAAVVRSPITFAVALTAMAVLLAGVTLEMWLSRRALRQSQAESRALQSKLATLESAQALLAVMVYEQGRQTGTARPDLLPDKIIPSTVRGLLDRGQALEAHEVAVSKGRLRKLGLPVARRLRSELRRRGYLVKAREVAYACVRAGGNSADVRERAMIEGEIAVLSGALTPSVRPEDRSFESRPGRVLHVVGNSLPHTQSGYTLRTHYTALAQRDAGLEPHVVTHMGFGHSGTDYAREEVDGIAYHRIPGATRGSEPLDAWLRAHVQRLANVVRVVRPSVLHAASDFLNAVSAEIVGREFGIPVVYESRGFWEETWLSRQAQTYEWDDLGRLESRFGLPDVYLWRREIEDRCRREASHVVTLADVMADRIEAGGVDRDRITVVPNGVDVQAFPMLTRNLELAEKLGIDPDTTVIGYISSIVEYEGIDTLVDAYAQLREQTSEPVALLIVGDGLVRESLVRQAEQLGVPGVIFTGKVPHDEVLDYYSLIDVFVVPRKPVEVCHLVTPL